MNRKKSKFALIAGLSLVSLAAIAAPIKMSERECLMEGGTPIYDEMVVLGSECGFLSDLFGLCEVGSTEVRYSGYCRT